MNLSTAQLAEATKNLYKEFTNEDGWIMLKEKEAVTVMKKKDQRFHAFRGDTTLPFPANYCMRLLWDPKGKGNFDPLCSESLEIKRIDDCTRIEHQIYRTKQCATEIVRDVLIVHHIVGLHTGGYLLLAQSEGVAVDVDAVPNSMRATVFVSGWMVQPRGSASCSVKFISQVDLAGLPAAVQNLAGSQQPLVVRRVADWLSQHQMDADNQKQQQQQQQEKQQEQLPMLPDDLFFACDECFAPLSDCDVICGNCQKELPMSLTPRRDQMQQQQQQQHGTDEADVPSRPQRSPRKSPRKVTASKIVALLRGSRTKTEGKGKADKEKDKE